VHDDQPTDRNSGGENRRIQMAKFKFLSGKRASRRDVVRRVLQAAERPGGSVSEFGPAAILTQNGSGKAAEAQDGRRGSVQVPGNRI